MKNKLSSICDNYIIFYVYAFFGWVYEVLLILIRDHKFVNRGVLFGPFLPIYGFGVLLLLFALRKFMKERHTTKSIFYTSLAVMAIATFTFITYIQYTMPTIYSVSVFLQQYGIALILLNVTAVLIFNYLVRVIKEVSDVNLNIILVFIIIWVLTTSLEYVSHFAIDKLTGIKLWDYTKDFLNINSRVCFEASRNFAILGTTLLYLIQPFIDKFLKKISLNKKIVLALVVFIPMIIDFVINVILK